MVEWLQNVENLFKTNIKGKKKEFYYLLWLMKFQVNVNFWYTQKINEDSDWSIFLSI